MDEARDAPRLACPIEMKAPRNWTRLPASQVGQRTAPFDPASTKYKTHAPAGQAGEGTEEEKQIELNIRN